MSSLKGVWVHPADGEDYPNELRMTVGESTAMGATTWQTETDNGPEFGVSVWQYIHLNGSDRLMFAVKRKQDGSWSPLSTMADVWSVAGGTARDAREVMHRFFTAAGYSKA